MLEAISICNFALIDKLAIEFGPGLNIISGETGAGKSIIIDALGMALGERASSDFLRTGASSALVEAIFSLEPGSRLMNLLNKIGIPIADRRLILTRELNISGRNYCRLNGRLVTTMQLKEVAQELVDIHGQHQHQSLLRSATHLAFLDAFGGPDQLALAKKVRDLYSRYSKLKTAIENLEQAQRERAQRIDLLKYQIEEIEAAGLELGEKEELEQEKERLKQRESLLEAAANAYVLLHGGPEQGAVDLVGQAQVCLDQVAKIDERLAAISKELTTNLYNLEELVPKLRQYQEDFPQDPHRLSEVEDRLQLIRSLARKYGPDIPSILQHAQTAADELARLEKEQIDQTKLADELVQIKKQLAEAAGRLTSKRRRTAAVFQQEVQDELADLGMEKAQLQVSFLVQEEGTGLSYDGRKLKIGPTGFEQAEFLLAANPGEMAQPLAKIASGGEIARTMLAIKTVLADTDDVPTLIFDEVDAGIGGRAAEKVGLKLEQVSSFHQVICITHLPQIAARGDTHYYIYKETIAGKTYTRMDKLSSTARVQELARMLAGSSINPVVLRHAEQLLQNK
ncbi:MAG: DNA repair protein RecN [Firmicutes bacterium]|nr:DNA repair protein RecN [Bacillota bacterium]